MSIRLKLPIVPSYFALDVFFSFNSGDTSDTFCWGYKYWRNLPREGSGYVMAIHHMKPNIKLEDGGSVKGLKPIGDLRPVVIIRRNGMTCEAIN